jgi:hypothetical protein
MEATGLAALEISTLGIALKAPRATTGPDVHIMDEYGMNGQTGTMEGVRNQRPLPAG